MTRQRPPVGRVVLKLHDLHGGESPQFEHAAAAAGEYATAEPGIRVTMLDTDETR